MTRSASPEPAAAKPRPSDPRKRRWLRRLLRVSILLVVVLIAVGWFVTRPERLGRIVAGGLSYVTEADVGIETAHLSWNGRLSLRRMQLRVPDAPAGGDLLLEAERITVQPRLSALLVGKLVLESVVAERPQVYFVQDADTGRYLHQHLRWFDPTEKVTDRDIWPSDPLPDVFIHQAGLHFLEVDDGHVQTMGRLAVGGTLSRDDDSPQSYNFSLRQHTQDDHADAQAPQTLVPLIHGHIDLRDRNLLVQLDNFQFDSDQQHLLPRQVRKIWRQLSPSGSLPNLTVRYTESGEAGLHAELHVHDVALNLPIPEVDLRLFGSTGRFVLEGERLGIENLTGQIAGITYHIHGYVEGLGLDAPVELSLRTEPFDVAADSPYLAGLPPAVQHTYNQFAPSGRFQLEASISRAERGQALRYRGQLALLGAQLTSQRFAYTVRDMHGQVRFDNEQIRLEQVHGRGLSGAKVTMRGEITAMGDGSLVDLHMTADDVPVDEHLLAALDADERRVFDMFFNEPAYRRLISEGVIAEDPQADGLFEALDEPAPEPHGEWEPPIFVPGGVLSITSHIQRAPGPDQPVLATTQVSGRGVQLIYEEWPYPMQVVDGTVTIRRRHVTLDHLVMRGLTGATGVIHGHVDIPAQGGLTPAIDIRDVRVPFDEFLLASIPSPQDDWVRQFGAQGELVGQARVFRNDEGRVDIAVDMDIAHGSATPFDGRVTLENLRGSVLLGRGMARIDTLAGDYDGGVLRAEGRVGWGEAASQSALRLWGENLPVAEPLLDLLPPNHDARATLGGLFAEYDPSGRFDASLTAEGLGTPQEKLRILLRPRSLSFSLQDRPVDFHQVGGEIRADGKLVELDAVRGEFEHGWMQASGLVSLRPRGGALLELSGQASQIDDTARALLPDAVREVIDALNLDGGYELRESTLQWHGEPVDDQAQSASAGEKRPLAVSFNGKLDLMGATGEIGMPMTDLDGTLELSAHWSRELSHPHIELDLHAAQLRVNDRRVSPMSMSLRSHELEPMLLIDARGTMYDGAATVQGWLAMSNEDRFRIDFTLADVHAERFLAPPDVADRTADRQDDQEADASDADHEPAGAGSPGVLSANLQLEGQYDDPETLRGRGAIQLRDMQFYERPLPLAMLQAANLSLPMAGSFDRVSARYRVEGPTVRFDVIRFETPTFMIEGTGTMDYPTQELDLAMISRGNVGANLGPLSEMLALFKDELIGIEVRGTLTDPQARVVAFENIRRSWQELFGRSEHE